MQSQIGKKSFVSEIIVSELVALNCLHKEENTCHRQSVLRKRSEILHSTNIDFSQLNYVYRYQQIS